jgi:uncharacterized protein (TIGR02118 family)
MVRRVTLVRRRPELAPEHFEQRWLGEHADIAKRLPTLRGYRIATVSAAERQMPWDGLAELWFDTIDAARAALGTSDAGRELALHTPTMFADVLPFFVEEHVVIPPPGGTLR